MPVERRWDPPHPAPALTQLGLLLRGVFVQAVRGVGDDGVNAGVVLFPQPVEAVGVVERGLTERGRASHSRTAGNSRWTPDSADDRSR